MIDSLLSANFWLGLYLLGVLINIILYIFKIRGVYIVNNFMYTKGYERFIFNVVVILTSWIFIIRVLHSKGGRRDVFRRRKD